MEKIKKFFKKMFWDIVYFVCVIMVTVFACIGMFSTLNYVFSWGF